MVFAVAAAAICLAGAQSVQVYVVDVSAPTAAARLAEAGLRTVEEPPFRATAHVVGGTDVPAVLERLGLSVISESKAVPFRWWRPEEIAPPVRQDVPAPPLAATDGYHDRRATESLLTNWARHYPDRCALYSIGKSVAGTPILALRISDHPTREEDEPAVLFCALIHANELLTTEIALDLCERLILDYPRDADTRRRVDANDIWVVPIMNPDGHDLVFDLDRRWRKNAAETLPPDGMELADGVDLNRNFPVGWDVTRRSSADRLSSYYRGPAPASEPETRALMALADECRFVAEITYHNSGGWVLYPYSARSLVQPEPNYARMFADAMVAGMTVEESTRPYRVGTEMYPVAGVDQDYYYHAFGTLAYIAECGRKGGAPSLVRWREPILSDVRHTWRFVLAQMTDGPRVWGHVRDADTGAPLPAVVRLAEQNLKMGEQWTAHPRTGRFDRLLTSPATVTLVAELPGYASAEHRVSVDKGPVEINLALRRREGVEPAE